MWPSLSVVTQAGRTACSVAIPRQSTGSLPRFSSKGGWADRHTGEQIAVGVADPSLGSRLDVLL